MEKSHEGRLTPLEHEHQHKRRIARRVQRAYQDLRQHGLCVWCKAPVDQAGHALCSYCTVQARNTQRVRHAQWKADGLCTTCGGERDTPDSSRCGRCQTRDRAAAARKKAQSAAANAAVRARLEAEGRGKGDGKRKRDGASDASA